jgi:cytochrome oxidase Cu insertion factor (SCO1/SenC/PrrC family)
VDFFSFHGVSAEVVSGEFDLMDHNGNLVTESTYSNKLRLVFFGFTRCPIICPTTMSQISKVMSLLADRSDQVQPIFISIDPDYDTTETVADYISVFHPSVVGLTGTVDQIERAANNYNVTYGQGAVNSLGDAEEIYHTSYLYLMDRNGDLIDLIGYGAKPKVILEKMKEYL